MFRNNIVDAPAPFRETGVWHRMNLAIHTTLDYELPSPVDVLLQIEAAAIPEQQVISANIDLPKVEHFARVPAQDGVGERIWLRTGGRLQIEYRAEVAIQRILADPASLQGVPPHLLPGEAVPYLMPSRYCPSDQFHDFVFSNFGHLPEGPRVAAIRDWVASNVAYVPGSSHSQTTAIDTFHGGQGICRDYAHLVITLVRAANIPARIASVYALGVEPPDFHAVAEVFLGDTWHLVDATGMAREGAMAKIGIGRDAADVAFLSIFGEGRMIAQQVSVEPA